MRTMDGFRKINDGLYSVFVDGKSIGTVESITSSGMCSNGRMQKSKLWRGKTLRGTKTGQHPTRQDAVSALKYLVTQEIEKSKS